MSTGDSGWQETETGKILSAVRTGDPSGRHHWARALDAFEWEDAEKEGYAPEEVAAMALDGVRVREAAP